MTGAAALAVNAVTPARLLVGVAPDVAVHRRPGLVDLLARLADLPVRVQVAMLGDGRLRADLEAIADVRVLDEPPERSPGWVAEAIARRAGGDLADRVFDRRVAGDRRWMGEPDGILLQGTFAAPLLRYVRDPAVRATTFVHPLGHLASGLHPADLRRLLDRTIRFLVPPTTAPVDPGAAIGDLATCGVPAARIVDEPVPVTYPPVPFTRRDRASVRRRVGVGADETVVAVLGVPDWVDCPDLTLGVAWELERLGGAGAPTVLWTGMPADGPRRWPIDFDLDRMGLRSVRPTPASADWPDLVAAADVILLPIRSPEELPDDFAEHAARVGRPVLCWEGHPEAAQVERWRGTVVARGDVEAMAAAIWSMVRDRRALGRARRVGWSLGTADLEVLLPVEVPAP